MAEVFSTVSLHKTGPHEKHLGRGEFSFFRHENDNGTFKSSDKWQRTEYRSKQRKTD